MTFGKIIQYYKAETIFIFIKVKSTAINFKKLQQSEYVFASVYYTLKIAKIIKFK